VGRFVRTAPRVLILDEPTAGVDVGARAEMHRLIRELADAGTAVLVISSDFAELAICERVAVMRDGRIAHVIEGREATKERLTSLCFETKEDPR
jgi:ribose transport system ATP-binding protein